VLSTGLALAEHRFIDNENGTFSDPKTGLMWSLRDNQGDITWLDARQWARFTFPSTLPRDQGNWRLPTSDELSSLESDNTTYEGYESDCGITVRIERAVELTCAFVWTADESGIQARYFNFQQGVQVLDRKTKSRGHRALAVRTLSDEERSALQQQ